MMTNAMHTAKMHALVLGGTYVRKKALVHTCVLDTCYLCLIGGAAWVSERGVLVRKENRTVESGRRIA